MEVIVAHVLLIAGAYFMAWGFSLPPIDNWKAANVFVRPLFWGMVTAGGGICMLTNPLLGGLFS